MGRTGPTGSVLRVPVLGPTTAQLLTLALVAGATALRVWLGEAFQGVVPFSFYFPMVLAVALLGGWPAALTATVTTTLAGWWLFLGAGRTFELATAGQVINLLLYLFSAALMAFTGVYVRALIGQLRDGNARLAERELQYRTLFNSIAEGFCLVEAIRGPDGRLVDYRILEANPAIHQLLGAQGDIEGRTSTDLLPKAPPAWLAACDRALSGPPITFEFQAPTTGRWFEVHLNRVGSDRLAQLVIEITDRKTGEARQSELFDELNHRVKNNLAMISSMLALQARMGEAGRVRDDLNKAVDRIQAIAEVHASLYRSGRKDEVDFAAYLQDLCGRLSRSLVEGERIAIEVEAEDAALPLDRAVALGVVVNELVTNAAKHAYPPPVQGKISVRLEHSLEGLVVSVGDDGAGLPTELPASGLGMRLVRSLVQQIGASLEVEHHPGATFRVRLPEPAARQQAAAGQARLF